MMTYDCKLVVQQFNNHASSSTSIYPKFNIKIWLSKPNELSIYSPVKNRISTGYWVFS